MNGITKGEEWKMGLLSGELSASEATDQLLENRLALSNRELLEVMQPMAELRAGQIEAGLQSDEEATRMEAQRMAARYGREPGESSAVQQAHLDAEALGGGASPLTRQVLGNWLGKIAENHLVGEMEKELDRTVDTYKREKEENKLTLRHRSAGLAI